MEMLEQQQHLELLGDAGTTREPRRNPAGTTQEPRLSSALEAALESREETPVFRPNNRNLSASISLLVDVSSN